MLSDRCLPVLSVCLSVCDARVLWPNGWTDQDETWHAGRHRPWQQCVRWGPSSPSPKGAQPPHFSAHICCGQTAGWIRMPLGKKVGFSPGDCVLDGDPDPLPTKGAEPPPQFSAHFYCGQTAGCIKMPLGMQVGLSPGDFVLDGDPAPFPKRRRSPGVEPPIFDPCLLWPNGWMDQDGTWHGGSPWSSPHCARWGHSSLPKKGEEPPIFGSSLLWPNDWMHQDATWYGGRPQPRRLCVRWGPSPYPKRGEAPFIQFSAHVYCGQTAAWIKVPLGTEVGLGLRDIVFDMDPATSRKRARPPHPIFGPRL